jgi:uncharacterized membrane protein YbaN (DUF454 family)
MFHTLPLLGWFQARFHKELILRKALGPKIETYKETHGIRQGEHREREEV